MSQHDLLGYLYAQWLQEAHSDEDRQVVEEFVAKGREILSQNQPIGTTTLEASFAVTMQDGSTLRFSDNEPTPIERTPSISVSLDHTNDPKQRNRGRLPKTFSQGITGNDEKK